MSSVPRSPLHISEGLVLAFNTCPIRCIFLYTVWAELVNTLHQVHNSAVHHFAEYRAHIFPISDPQIERESEIPINSGGLPLFSTLRSARAKWFTKQF